VEGFLGDFLSFVKPWGFSLDAITVPAFVQMAPLGQWLATHVPGAVAHLEQNEGHYSLIVVPSTACWRNSSRPGEQRRAT
jgi:hypothetical protein